MKNKMNNNYGDPLLGGLSLFNMNYAPKGISWADGIYQKLEKICTDSDVVQVPCKYVDAVGDHFKQMLDGFASEWLSPSGGSDNDSVSSFENNNIAEDCMKSTDRIYENALDEKMSACFKAESILSSMEDLRSLDTDQGLSHQNICEEYSTESISTDATGSQSTDGTGKFCNDSEPVVSSLRDLSLDTSCSIKSIATEAIRSKFPDIRGEDYSTTGEYNDNAQAIVHSTGDLSLVTSVDALQEMGQNNTCEEHGVKTISKEATGTKFSSSVGENHKDVSNPIVSPDDITSSLTLSHEVRPSESHQNELTEESSMLPCVTSSTEIHDNCISQETMSLLESIKYEKEQQVEPNKLEAPERLPEIEFSDDGDLKHMFNGGDVVHPTTKLMESFENLNLVDCLVDDESFELALVSHHTCKNASTYKKKLKQVFISKVLSAKRRRRVANRHYDIDMGNRQSTDTYFSSGEQSLKTHDAHESEWVLL